MDCMDTNDAPAGVGDPLADVVGVQAPLTAQRLLWAPTVHIA